MNGVKNNQIANATNFRISPTEEWSIIDMIEDLGRDEKVKFFNDKTLSGDMSSEYPRIDTAKDREDFCLEHNTTDLLRYSGTKTCVEIPEGVRVIKGGAFYGCHDVGVIVIPKTVGAIEPDAFKACSALLLCLDKDMPSGWYEKWNCGLEYIFDIENKIKTANQEINDGNYANSVPFIKKLAERGYYLAQNIFGWCYCYGKGTDQSDKEAFKWWKKAAEQGYGKAQYNLASCYYYGEGTAENKEKAFKWFQKAAKQGYAEALLEIAECYYNGEGTAKNKEEAVEWYKKATEQENVHDLVRKVALFKIAKCYYNGEVIVKNKEQVVEWYKKAAAEELDADAKYHLALCYYDGKGIEKSEKQAVEWFKKAAGEGHAMAQYNLGEYYYKMKEYSEALTWLANALAGGVSAAQKYINKINKKLKAKKKLSLLFGRFKSK